MHEGQKAIVQLKTVPELHWFLQSIFEDAFFLSFKGSFMDWMKNANMVHWCESWGHCICSMLRNGWRQSEWHGSFKWFNVNTCDGQMAMLFAFFIACKSNQEAWRHLSMILSRVHIPSPSFISILSTKKSEMPLECCCGCNQLVDQWLSLLHSSGQQPLDYLHWTASWCCIILHFNSCAQNETSTWQSDEMAQTLFRVRISWHQLGSRFVTADVITGAPSKMQMKKIHSKFYR